MNATTALGSTTALGPTTVTLHDPTSETAPATRPRCTPPPSLDGRTVALFDIGKSRADEFLDYLEARLAARGIATARFAKPTNAKPATTGVLDAIAAGAHVVVEALAD